MIKRLQEENIRLREASKLLTRELDEKQAYAHTLETEIVMYTTSLQEETEVPVQEVETEAQAAAQTTDSDLDEALGEITAPVPTPVEKPATKGKKSSKTKVDDKTGGGMVLDWSDDGTQDDK